MLDKDAYATVCSCTLSAACQKEALTGDICQMVTLLLGLEKNCKPPCCKLTLAANLLGRLTARLLSILMKALLALVLLTIGTLLAFLACCLRSFLATPGIVMFIPLGPGLPVQRQM